ncbi:MULTISPECIES: cell wall hydrolase [Bradyrhizobium]|uniref:Spore germination cell wall hydrolase CwlJ-like protein n=1 Tax=Bradyrhizobium ottawaense TaxID=931866 RepID=A0ABV4FWA1_9BRAD|nr:MULTISPECIES: cell wall hydrolase [Bradyrhizobium]MBR1291755.1 cell wall hydrolase [Bradyrhizobium ottawaense]MBR1330793.1 cell wall hydrolase [Bradyrhizobium ottawaense]MBR1335988.1 cell wall hydrolase [Bradyrhizobium ottawaense]MDA9418675.1 hydrolase [Bradyrhizobium sp. CCBAU 25360]MDA9445327.1 hydrolase [Bradyrhizobium sp. CCBAU 21360]
MSVLRNHPKGARFASFGIGLCIFALMPRETGYQDIASLLARQPGVAERWQKQVFSAASSIQLATYSFSRPIGTSVPQSAMVRLASLDGRDVTGAISRNPALQAAPRYQASDFPKVDRSMKGDRLATVAPTEAPEAAAPAAAPPQQDPATSNSSVFGAKTAALPQAMSPESAAALDPELQEALRAPPLPQYSNPPRASDAARAFAVQPLEALKRTTAPTTPVRDPFSVKTSNLFFGSSSLGGNLESIESWQPGAEPLIVMPDPDMKVTASLSPPTVDIAKDIESGESVAPKGEVNADNQRARSPAERLALDDKSRAKSEKCLAEAVYFESRGEAVRGQMAVAQVVMNRVFSGKYPDTVCGAVYQNKHRHLACQFTFACDNNADVIREPEMWERAKKIAKAMLDGQIWLPEVGKSTHYHAYWVRPSWVAEMKKMYKTGVHTFYRPRAWGDGSEEPSWGTPAQTAALSAELAQEAKSSAEMGVSERR